MELNRAIFTAPSIPKLSKKTISSSVLSGALKPQIKLQKSTFSFIKPVAKTPDTEKISQPIINQNIFVESQVEETNKILLQIQKQLELDYAARIDEEKKIITTEKKKISARKVSEKESKIEKGGKGILGKTFDKVTTPFKSIFQKLVDFFSIILTGILLNNAFKWLGKEENRKKLSEFFNFVKEYWQELLIIFAVTKLAKLVGGVLKVALLLRRLVKWFAKLKLSTKRPPAPTGPKAPGPKPGFAKPKSPLERGGGQRPISRPSPPKPILGPTGRPAVTDPLSRYRGPGSAPGRAPGIPKPGGGVKPAISTPQPKGKLNFGKFTGGGLRMAGSILRMIGLVMLADEITKDYQRGDYKAIVVKLTAAGLGWLVTGLMLGGGTGATATGVGAAPGVPMIAGSYVAGLATDQAIRSMFGYGMFQNQDGKKNGGTIKGLSLGGTVGKGDRTGVDTTPAQTIGGGNVLLNQGEEVVRTSASMLFRPLLKDINDNAGRMWQAFESGIKLQDSNTSEQLKLTQKFGNTVKQFKDFVDSEIQRIKLKNVGSTTTPPPAPILPPPKETTPKQETQQQSIPKPPTPSAASQTQKQSDSTATSTPSKVSGSPQSSTSPTLKPQSTSQDSTSASISPTSVSRPFTPIADVHGENMAKWADANPLLAAAKAERDRTRGTSETTNPLMTKIFGSEYVEKLPAAKEPVGTITPLPVKTRNLKSTKSGGGGVTVLPPQVVATPKQPKSPQATPKRTGTAIPYVSPIDSNPYNSLALTMYGMVGMEGLYPGEMEAIV